MVPPITGNEFFWNESKLIQAISFVKMCPGCMPNLFKNWVAARVDQAADPEKPFTTLLGTLQGSF
ncbi:MAG: hypothetical protein DME19_05560 [Verrucomicrobia bacterium]|nr:MAG: hypothetical protein DME19_05560 [Verrucomicrobiota bacterium]